MFLTIIFCYLFLSILLLASVSNRYFIKVYSLFTALIVLLLSIKILIDFNYTQYYFQSISIYKVDTAYINWSYTFGFDGISILFFFLTTFIVFLCVFFMLEDTFLKENIIIILSIEFLLLLVFSILDILLFYIFFEIILIPMYFLIGIFGSRERKIRAVYLLFFYTLIGSFFFLLGIMYIFSIVGTLNLEYILTWKFTFYEQIYLWLAFFFSFAAKVPLFPLHIWLPEAHVEAPTVGSVLLAGILLKLGVYGFLRFNLLLFPQASFFFAPLIAICASFGIIYTSFSAIRQTDLKRIIAYSSVSHMNLIILGLFSFNFAGLEGALLQSLSHGYVSSALFFLIGMLYNRYHSKLLYYYGGLVHTMPIFVCFFFFFTLANLALPGTSNFIGEFILLNAIFKNNFFLSIICVIGVVLCGVYSLWLYNRISFGNLKQFYLITFFDLTIAEFILLISLFFFTLFLGLYPTFFINFITFTLFGISTSFE